MSLATFAQEAFSDFQRTAAVAPSSRFLAEAMVGPLPLEGARVVVEFGPGTGVMTRELLQRTPLDATVIAFEISSRFVDYLKEEFPDPRLRVVRASAARAGDELALLGVTRVDAVLSSLGLSLIPEEQNLAMFNGLLPFMDENSVFTQFQYVHRIRYQEGRLRYFDVGRFLEQHFDDVDRRVIWRNLPPAFVFTCRKTVTLPDGE